MEVVLNPRIVSLSQLTLSWMYIFCRDRVDFFSRLEPQSLLSTLLSRRIILDTSRHQTYLNAFRVLSSVSEPANANPRAVPVPCTIDFDARQTTRWRCDESKRCNSARWTRRKRTDAHSAGTRLPRTGIGGLEPGTAAKRLGRTGWRRHVPLARPDYRTRGFRCPQTGGKTCLKPRSLCRQARPTPEARSSWTSSLSKIIHSNRQRLDRTSGCAFALPDAVTIDRSSS